MTSLIARFVRNQRGATAIEYAFVALFVALAIITVLTTLGTRLSGSYASVANSFP